MISSIGFIKVRGSRERVPVGKIVCLGRNYADHAKEMKTEVPAKPVLFLKPPTAIIHDGQVVIPPRLSADLHHEVEMVLLLGRRGKNLEGESALKCIAGFGVGLDMTLRDIQAEAKAKGLPWTIAKGFDTSAPVSDFVPSKDVPDPHNMNIALRVNGQTRQQSNTGNMLFTLTEIISYVSSIFTLEPGDLIFTGTPEGVGRVVPGDRLEAVLQSVATLRVTIAAGNH